tara:strand:+ start:47 stop:592 length:546 start_codon:yes stop_codon:yes gene_type:complete
MSQLKVNSIIPVGGLPSGANGGIIQVVQTVKTDTFSQSSLNDSTFSNDTGLNVTITPSSNSNKIRLTGSVVVSMDQDNDGIGIGLFKGGSVVSGALGDASGSRTQCMSMDFQESYGGECRNLAFDFIDSPATTSATTYGIRVIFFSGTASSTVYLNRSQSDDNNVYRPRSISTITAMEVSV